MTRCATCQEALVERARECPGCGRAVPDTRTVERLGPEHEIWHLLKSGHDIHGVVRVTSSGYELRVDIDGARHWAQVYPPGAEDLLSEASDRKRTEFETDGWLDAVSSRPLSW